jgi:hypothetical protein
MKNISYGSINDEKLGSTLGVGAVGLCVVRDLVPHAWLQRELSPVFELGVKDICTNGSLLERA